LTFIGQIRRTNRWQDSMFAPSLDLDSVVLGRLERLDRAAVFVAAAITIAVQVLWITPAAHLMAPELFHMRPATAAGIFLSAAALHLSRQNDNPQLTRLANILGVAVALLGAVVLVAYGLALPIHLLFQPPSAQSAVCFIFGGVTLALIRRDSGTPASVADVAAVTFSSIVLILLGSYVFGLMHFSDTSSINLSSPPTLFCYLLIAICLLGRRAQAGGALGLLVTRGAGGRIARVVMPLALVAPFFGVAIIDWLDDSAILDRHDASAVTAPLLAILILAAITWLGLRINALESQLRSQSMTDPLTGAMNRRGFDAVAEDATASALRHGLPVRVYYFDLDDLKRINDAYGHDEGSRLIADFSAALAFAFRPKDMVARIGGDEFLVLTVGDTGTAAEALRRVEDRIADMNEQRLPPLRISYSAGYAGRAADGAMPLGDLIALADAAMYVRKSTKRAA
jgi:diguanylate cyclase (GGDEF)-like protein